MEALNLIAIIYLIIIDNFCSSQNSHNEESENKAKFAEEYLKDLHRFSWNIA